MEDKLNLQELKNHKVFTVNQSMEEKFIRISKDGLS